MLYFIIGVSCFVFGVLCGALGLYALLVAAIAPAIKSEEETSG